MRDEVPEIRMQGARLVGGFALWGALFFGDPDIADAIIYYLSEGNLM